MSWKGVSSGKPHQPSADRNRKASVEFCTEAKSEKGVPWKGKPSPDGARPDERKAIYKPGDIRDIKSLKKTSLGKAPKG